MKTKIYEENKYYSSHVYFLLIFLFNYTVKKNHSWTWSRLWHFDINQIVCSLRSNYSPKNHTRHVHNMDLLEIHLCMSRNQLENSILILRNLPRNTTWMSSATQRSSIYWPSLDNWRGQVDLVWIKFIEIKHSGFFVREFDIPYWCSIEWIVKQIVVAAIFIRNYFHHIGKSTDSTIYIFS